jgi:hypothetical protein
MNDVANGKQSQQMRMLHLWTLASFAFTQPLLSALVRQTVYLHDQQFGWLELSSLMLILVFMVPTACIIFDWFFQRLSRLSVGWGKSTIFTFLFMLVLLSLLRPYDAHWWEVTKGNSGLLVLAVVVPFASGIASLYDRSREMRFWLTLISPGIFLFPAIFLWQIHQLEVEESSAKGRAAVTNPVPVVFVVFDEFNGTTLVDEQMQIDELRFPQFARLAKLSTWYRNATTVSPRTDIAVPAILSGRYPVTPLSPLANEYPGNLLELIQATKTFDLKAFEPVTRLCPKVAGDPTLSQRPASEKAFELIHAMAAVYPRLVLTNDTPFFFPTIPRSWFSVKIEPYELMAIQNSDTSGTFHYPGTEYRELQLHHVLKCLKNSEKPEFCFFHTVLPHYPWTFLASGEQYQSEFAAPPFPPGAQGELGEDWTNDPVTVLRSEFHYRQQVGYVDRFIGRLLDRLELTGLLDRCLLVVTADHGVSFRPGHSRRVPDAENLPDILSIPLFIKYPGQSQGSTDDRNVESIDIFPTIAEVLGMTLSTPVDGIPISAPVRSRRKTFYFQTTMTPVEPDFPQRALAIRRQYDLFGSGKLDQPPATLAAHPEWHGRSMDSFEIEDRTIPAEFFDIQNREVERLAEIEFVPRLITGMLAAEHLPEIPAEIIVAIDGIVCDTGKSYGTPNHEQGFQFLITKSMKEGPLGSVELFVVDSTKSELRLRRMEITGTVRRPDHF